MTLHPLTDAQKAQIAARKRIIEADLAEAERARSEALWRESSDWVKEAEQLAEATRQRKEAELCLWRIQALRAELDLDD